MIMNTKVCRICKLEKPCGDFYRGNGLYGRRSACKVCEGEIRKASEKRQEYIKLYRAKESVKLANKLYQAEYKKKYNQTERGKILRKKGMEKYRKTELGKATKARSNHKRRLIIDSLPNNLTAKEWEEIKIAQNYRCALCGEIKQLTRDHIIPVSLGGALVKENIQGLCKSCNSKKNNKILTVNNRFLTRKGVLNGKFA